MSMPSWELFDDQDQAYRDQVLPPAVTARVSVEQAADLRLGEVRRRDRARRIGMRTFGASAPLKDLLKEFGFTPDRIVAAAKEQIKRAEKARA